MCTTFLAHGGTEVQASTPLFPQLKTIKKQIPESTNAGNQKEMLSKVIPTTTTNQLANFTQYSISGGSKGGGGGGGG